MPFGEKLYVWLTLMEQRLMRSVTDAVQPPDHMEFLFRRRAVVSYVCAQCVADGVANDLCRSPEWDPTDAAFGHEVPQEVMEWAERHAREHVMMEREAE